MIQNILSCAGMARNKNGFERPVNDRPISWTIPHTGDLLCKCKIDIADIAMFHAPEQSLH